MLMQMGRCARKFNLKTLKKSFEIISFKNNIIITNFPNA